MFGLCSAALQSSTIDAFRTSDVCLLAIFLCVGMYLVCFVKPVSFFAVGVLVVPVHAPIWSQVDKHVLQGTAAPVQRAAHCRQLPVRTGEGGCLLSRGSYSIS